MKHTLKEIGEITAFIGSVLFIAALATMLLLNAHYNGLSDLEKIIILTYPQ
jgi:hypothetical protein